MSTTPKNVEVNHFYHCISETEENTWVLSTCCVNCGKGGDVSCNLKACTACSMVKYCSRDCQIAHRPQHKEECKKRAAELQLDNKVLPEQSPPKEDRLPLRETGKLYMTCCGKTACSGCIHAVVERDTLATCPFCRTPPPSSNEEATERIKKRMEVNDAEAIYEIAACYFYGDPGYPRDEERAIELWHRAGKLGYAKAYTNIGMGYIDDDGVIFDKKKVKHYWELGAIKGSARARGSLGGFEGDEGNMDRAVKHFLIAVSCGMTECLDMIKNYYMNGCATKDDYLKALRAYQTYLNEIKSDQRDAAAAANERYRYY